MNNDLAKFDKELGKAKIVATCPKCFEVRPLFKHHWAPKRFFGANGKTLLICAACHLEIERILPLDYEFTVEEYLLVHQAWLRYGDAAALKRIKKLQEGRMI